MSVSTVKADSRMPAGVGRSLDEVWEKLRDLPDQTDVETYDLVYNRSVWDATNWVVIDQAPAPGAVLTEGQRVCLGIKKKSDGSAELNYQFPDSCPSNVDPNAWPPSGFEPLLDGSFAFNVNYRPNDISHQPCKLESDNHLFISNTNRGEGNQRVGTEGRCGYWEFMSKAKCTSVQVRFQWLTSLNEVIGLSTTWVSGPFVERGTFRVVAFLPNRAWDKALGGSRVFEISCS